MFNEFKKEIDLGGRKLTFETGKIARQADGAVLVTYGETKIRGGTVSGGRPCQHVPACASVCSRLPPCAPKCQEARWPAVGRASWHLGANGSRAALGRL